MATIGIIFCTQPEKKMGSGEDDLCVVLGTSTCLSVKELPAGS